MQARCLRDCVGQAGCGGRFGWGGDAGGVRPSGRRLPCPAKWPGLTSRSSGAPLSFKLGAPLASYERVSQVKQQAVSVVMIKCFVFILLLGLQPLSAMASVNACPETAQEYWKAFRISVLRGNLTAIINATRFPFVISGTLDEGEKKHVERKEFGSFFPALLKADPGLSPTPTTMKSLVKSTTHLPPSFCNSYGNQFRVGAWAFELTSEGWRFVESFFDD